MGYTGGGHGSECGRAAGVAGAKIQRAENRKLVTFLQNTGPWRRKLREAEYGSLEHDRAFLEQISPIHAVDRIVAPLFVAHGANDPRVPVAEAEQMVEALRRREVPVEYLRFDNEGHQFTKRSTHLVVYPAIAGFLQKHLRVQK